MDVERDGTDGAVVGVLQGESPETIADSAVIDGNQCAKVGAGSQKVSSGREVMLPVETVAYVETGDGGVGQGRSSVVYSHEG